MKKRKLLSALICTSLVAGALTLISCGESEPVEPDINTDSGKCIHVDEDGDKACDKCGAEYVIHCYKHVDKNGDNLCDVCEANMAPVTEDPTVEEPTVEEPTVEEPTVEEPTVEEPTVEEPTVEEPTVEEPTIEEPTVEEPTVEEPTVEEPTVEEPTIEEPTEDEAKSLALITDSKANFNIIYSTGTSSTIIRALDELIGDLAKLGLRVNLYNASAIGEENKINLYVGSIPSTDYEYDVYSLGPDGYAVRVLADAVQILGGSDDAVVDAIKIFKKDFLKITKKTERITEIILTEDMTVMAPQTEFRIKGLSIMGEDARGYVISMSEENKQLRAFAESLSSYLYDSAGYYLKVCVGARGEREIRLNLKALSGGEGLYLYTEGSSLVIDCEFPNKLADSAMKYFSPDKNFEIRFDEGFSRKENVRDIYYSDFGAIGNGNTNDYAALYEAHFYANEWGHRVVADKGATYYISSMSEAIPVRTDVEFGDAKFIIDDSWIKPENAERGINIFSILSDYPSFTVKPTDSGMGGIITAINAAGGIKRDEFERLDLGLGYPAMLVIKNADHKNYIRFGPNENDGSAQAEFVIVDENGYVNADTPLLFDYDKVTEITVYNITDRPITVSGGHFTTIANQAPSSYTYYSRGISITRHNTHVIGLTHTVEGEGDTGAPYNGFISISNTDNVLIENCTLVGHKTYKNESNVSMGTYDIGVGYSNNTVFRGCVQSNFFYNEEEKITSMSKGYWGISGTNFSKNFTFDRCRLTRYDAHCGVYNATVIDSEVATITLIGGGVARIENTKVYTDSGSTLISLRDDYGSTWQGDLIIKNVEIIPTSEKTSVTLLSGSWYNHDFGYKTYLPQNITIDNLTCKGAKTVNIFGGSLVSLGAVNESTLADGAQNLNPYEPTKRIEILGNPDGLNYNVSTAALYKDTVLVIS